MLSILRFCIFESPLTNAMSPSQESSTFGIQCRVICYCRSTRDENDAMVKHNGSLIYRWGLFIALVVGLTFCYNTSLYYNVQSDVDHRPNKGRAGLWDTTTLARFMYMKQNNMMRLGFEEEPTYAQNTSVCSLNLTALGPITVNKTKLSLQWVQQQFPEVKAGGFYAPVHCKPRHRVAILVPYRSRETNLAIFLYHIHPFLKKQLLQYRIFVIEQYGNTRKFNKGSLYNAAFLETQRFGDWHCLVFHDVDLLPLDLRILYSCPRMPTHMSPAVEQHGYILPYSRLFGGVTVMNPDHFRAVNGYSNSYWDWGAEDDDMFVRLQSRRLRMLRYDKSIGRYASLPHPANAVNYQRFYPLSLAKRRFRTEGLNTIEYKLMNITKQRLYTQLLINVNPYNVPI